jgi:pimeloyl-ACP methyl ester carboxylesterase
MPLASLAGRCMEAFFFGPGERRLFGVYHAPAVEKPVVAAAVLCYPFLQEYLRSHRAFHRLAGLLTARGWHVLRFDYSRCGDSYDDGVADAGAWKQDVQFACDELRERTQARQLALIGLRQGASLAASVSCDLQPLSELVMWDPVIDGPGFRRELLAFGKAVTLSPGARRKLEKLHSGDRGVGLELGPDVLETIGRLDRTEQLKATADRVLVLDSQGDESAVDFARRLDNVHHGVTLIRVSERGVWVERKRNDPRNISVPTVSLKAIVDWMTRTEG